MDDVLVIGKTWSEHLDNLKKVLDRFRTAGLRLKKAVRDFPTPVNVKEFTVFSRIGLVLPTLYTKFCKSSQPFTKKDMAYIWTPQCQQAFEEMKRLLTTSPLLVFPDFTKPY